MQLSLFPGAEFTAHKSRQDASVNWDRPADVGRLPASGQTRLRDATVGEMVEQARTVLAHYRREGPPARTVHFNFMARGEPLASRVVLADADRLLGELSRLAVALGLWPRHLV